MAFKKKRLLQRWGPGRKALLWWKRGVARDPESRAGQGEIANFGGGGELEEGCIFAKSELSKLQWLLRALAALFLGSGPSWGLRGAPGAGSPSAPAAAPAPPAPRSAPGGPLPHPGRPAPLPSPQPAPALDKLRGCRGPRPGPGPVLPAEPPRRPAGSSVRAGGGGPSASCSSRAGLRRAHNAAATTAAAASAAAAPSSARPARAGGRGPGAPGGDRRGDRRSPRRPAPAAPRPAPPPPASEQPPAPSLSSASAAGLRAAPRRTQSRRAPAPPLAPQTFQRQPRARGICSRGAGVGAPKSFGERPLLAQKGLRGTPLPRTPTPQNQIEF